MKNIILLLVLIGLVLQYGVNLQVQSIPDIMGSEKILLKKNPWQKTIHGLKIKGHGTVQGTVAIMLLFYDKNEPYRKIEVSGEFEFEWGNDWYADQAVIVYTAKEGQEGAITFLYRFLD